MKPHSSTTEFRSNCPINYFVELAGDKWSMLIIRDIAMWGRVQPKQFRQADEHIATNILVNRTSRLLENDILKKTPDTHDRRRDNYTLTEKGLGLVPLLLDIAAWSDVFGPENLYTSHNLLMDLKKDRQATVDEAVGLVRSGSYIFAKTEWQPHSKKTSSI